MRKYREYSDSELREKFPEVDDRNYNRSRAILTLKIKGSVKNKVTGEYYKTIEEVDEHIGNKTNLRTEEGLNENGWPKDDK